MGNDVPFFWFLDGDFLTFVVVCLMGYGLWQLVTAFWRR